MLYTASVCGICTVGNQVRRQSTKEVPRLRAAREVKDCESCIQPQVRSREKVVPLTHIEASYKSRQTPERALDIRLMTEQDFDSSDCKGV
jgi:hypothetical protein